MEIISLTEFREIKNCKPNDLIVIMDGPTKVDRIHFVRCPFVNEDSFQTKVLANNKKNGSYNYYQNSHYEQIKLKYKLGIDCIHCEKFAREPLI